MVVNQQNIQKDVIYSHFFTINIQAITKDHVASKIFALLLLQILSFMLPLRRIDVDTSQ